MALEGIHRKNGPQRAVESCVEKMELQLYKQMCQWSRIEMKELVFYVTLFITNLISSKKRLNKIKLLFKEFKKSCTSNFRGQKLCCEILIKDQTRSGGFGSHCDLILKTVVRRLDCQQIVHQICFKILHKVNGGGGNDDKFPLSIKCFLKAWVSNILLQCALLKCKLNTHP